MAAIWSTACLDWSDRLRGGMSIIPAPIFPEPAEQALAVFKQLRIVDAPGSPTFGEACEQWVFDLVASVFGAYDAESGRRLITEWFILVPKKNSKSTIAAGMMMTALILNWRQSAEFSILAPTVEVANNSFNPARDMCSERSDEELGVLMHAQTHVKTITHRESGAFLKVLAADENTVGGKKGVGTLIDELWLFGKMPNAENMLREATGGLASRPEGFTIYLTTQSDNPPAGIFAQKLKYARAVRDGRLVDPRFVPILYEFPKSMIDAGEHRKVENFGIVNPNLGFSVDREYLEREFHKAENDGEESMRGFLAKHLNVEIGLALMSDRWAGADYWEAQAVERFTLDDMIKQCDCIDIGIDGGGLDDLLGFAAIGRHAKTKNWMLWTHAWAHPSVLERRKDQVTQFRDFRDDADMTFVETIGDDFEEVASLVAKVHQAQLLDLIGLDASGIGGIKDAIVTARVPVEKMVAIGQGWQMHGAIKTAERKLAEKTMTHPGQRLMNYCVSNAKVVARGNAILINKQQAGSAKIDPLMAMFNAVTLMSLNPKSPKPKFQMFFAGVPA